MNTRRLTAIPIREKRLLISNMTRVIWREYLWNTGQISRVWLNVGNTVIDGEASIYTLGKVVDSSD